jgi:DNA adenine methylase
MYPGGKGGMGVAQRIISLMPPHRTYIEPFLGDAAVMRAKRPAAMNIGLDLDPAAPGLAWLAARRAEESIQACYWSKSGDGIQYLENRRFGIDDLVYCDPPYLMETRRGGRLYRCEMNAIDHRRLLRVLLSLPCMVMISGYFSKMYAEDLKGWGKVSYGAMTRGGRMATEWLWFNFPPPGELHDYRYVGQNFRERERIARKKRRWVERLRKMPALERETLLAAILEFGSSIKGEK